MSIQAKAITLVPLKDIKLNPKNRNKHPVEQIDRIVEIIKYQGFRRPGTISNKSGFLVCGEGRYLAAKKLGLKEMPVMFQDYIDEDQEYADGIADNAVDKWAELDLSSIQNDLTDLGEDFNLEMLGIRNFEIDEPFEAQADEDSVPEHVEPKTKLGDLYKLGDHRLLCGDSSDPLSIDLLTNKQEIELLLTDPPYGMSVVRADGNIGGVRTGTMVGASKMRRAKVGVYKPIIGDDEPFEPGFLLSIAKEQIIFGANHFSSKLPDSPHWIVWYKDIPVGTDFSGAELAWTSIEKKAVKTYKFTWAGMTREGNRKDELSKRVHSTQKPVGLFERIMEDYKPETVLDLYGGSGSTLIACEKTKRKCFMMELDPHYCDVIVARWEKYTGQKAEMINGNA